jgi:hypothetical protein
MKLNQTISVIGLILLQSAVKNDALAVERYFVFQGGTVLSEIHPIELHRNLLLYSHSGKEIDSVAIDSLQEVNEYSSTKTIHGTVIGMVAGMAIAVIATPRDGGEMNLVPLVSIIGGGVAGALLGTEIARSVKSSRLHDLSGKTVEEKAQVLRGILF